MSDSTTRIALHGSALRVAAIVPCHNEEMTIGKVVRDLHESVPDIVVYVYDNLSSDHTARVARAAGAIVRTETAKGKGNVVRRAFADIDADVYVLIDGDDTYDATATPRMINTLLAGPYDHVLGVRSPENPLDDVYRAGHERGNRMLNKVVEVLFGTNVGDMLSGFRVFSRRFVKSFPAFSSGFEIETELTVHSLSTRVPQTSVPVGFRERPAGSESKLRTYSDGWRILRLILSLTRHERPLAFHGLLSGVLALLAVAGLMPMFVTGHVGPGVASAVIAAGLLAVASLVIGGVSEAVRRSRHVLGRLNYLNHSPIESSFRGSREPMIFAFDELHRGLSNSLRLADLSEPEAV
jgi:hypothetical protein